MEQRYRETAKFLEKIYKFEEVDRPAYVIGPGVDFQYDDFSKVFLDPELQLKVQLAEIKTHEDKHIEDDYIPMLSPWFGVVGLLEGFGGKIHWSKRDYPQIEPVLQTPADIRKLKKPDVKSGLLGKELEYTRYFQKETNYKYPICLGEHMSPMEIIFALMDTTSILFAMMDEPKLVHDLLSMVTETVTDFIAEQRKISEEHNLGFCIGSSGEYIPEGYGIWLSADSIVNLSPDLFSEFFVPYINIISDHYGGVFIHSCGNFEHVLDSFDQIKNLRGIDFGASETSYDLIVEKFSGKAVLCPHLGLNHRIVFDSLELFTKYTMDKRKMNTGSYFQITDINSLGYGDDVVTKIGSFNNTILDEDRIWKLVDILRERA